MAWTEEAHTETHGSTSRMLTKAKNINLLNDIYISRNILSILLQQDKIIYL